MNIRIVGQEFKIWILWILSKRIASPLKFFNVDKIKPWQTALKDGPTVHLDLSVDYQYFYTLMLDRVKISKYEIS